MLSKRLLEMEQTLHSLARQGREVCERIERSQARMPLYERFESIDQELSSAPFAMSLLGLSLEAREAALAWILGQNQHLLKIHVPREVGLVELTLQEQGYVLEKSSGERKEFDQLETFLEEIRKSDLVRAGDSESWISPIRLRMAAPPDLQGMTICIPESVSVLASPAAFNRLVSQTNLLLLAAPLNYEPDENTRQVVEDLGASMDATWPLVLLPGGNETTGRNNSAASASWPRLNGFLRSRLILPPLQLPTSPLPETLGCHKIGKRSILRQALILSRQSERLRAMFELTIERFEEEQRSLKKQQKKVEQVLQNYRSETTVKELQEKTAQIRSYLNEEAGKLSHALADLSRQSRAANGEWGDPIREIIEKLDEGDMEQENLTQSVRLEVSSSLMERIESQICKIVRNQLGEDLVFIRDTRELWSRHIRAELSNYGQFDPVGESKVIDEGELWESLRPSLKCEISWRGEIPRTGVQQFFRAAYSPLIMGFMLFSIILPIFGGESMHRGTKLFALLFIAAFIFMLLRARKVLSRKRKEALDKEFLRVREILRGTVDRLISAANQEKARRLGAFLSDLQKEVVRRIELFADKIAGKIKEKAHREIVLAQNKIRQIEKTSRESMSLSQDLQRLNLKSCQTREETLRILQDPGLCEGGRP